MDPLTSGWTERHTRVALLLVVVVLALVAALQEEGVITVVVGACVLLAAVASTVLDRFGGLAVGLGAAALLTFARRTLDLWEPADLALASAQVVLAVLAGLFGGRLGMALRAADEEDDRRRPEVEPVFGSLGLLDADTAMARLEEEVDRARAGDRPLALALFDVVVHDTSLDDAAQTGARRAVARLVESRVRDADVPFALSDTRFGAILPETSAAEALVPVSRIIEAATTARFAVRGEGRDRLLSDTVEVAVGTARLDDRIGSAGALLDAATAALQRAPEAPDTPVPWLS